MHYCLHYCFCLFLARGGGGMAITFVELLLCLGNYFELLEFVHKEQRITTAGCLISLISQSTIYRVSLCLSIASSDHCSMKGNLLHVITKEIPPRPIPSIITDNCNANFCPLLYTNRNILLSLKTEKTIVSYKVSFYGEYISVFLLLIKILFIYIVNLRCIRKNSLISKRK